MRARRNKVKWEELGLVTVDTARILLTDPTHVDVEADEEGQIAVGDRSATGVLVQTGIGDGNYLVEGRFVDCGQFGERLAEIRVRFLDAEGNWLGGYVDETSESSD
jgi:hypothetical protein